MLDDANCSESWQNRVADTASRSRPSVPRSVLENTQDMIVVLNTYARGSVFRADAFGR